ncbi:MAG: SGNH/GDSL hydrolase family protein [Draconibacterium sp.]
MKIQIKLFLLAIFISCNAFAQSQLVKNLQQGKDQLVIVYGTSLSSGVHGKAWMQTVADYFNNKYGNHLKYQLAGKGGMWSTWGVQHLEDSVITKKPDAVIIEFGINDAFYKYRTSPELAQLNLEYIIDRIQLAYPDCEIILQVMNMPIGKSAGYRPNLNDYYNMYREVAQKRKLLLIDHYPNWQKILDLGEAEFLKHVPDGIHPNDASGRTIIAPFIIAQLETAK